MIVHREGCTNVNPMQKCSNGHYKVVGRTAIYFTLCIEIGSEKVATVQFSKASFSGSRLSVE